MRHHLSVSMDTQKLQMGAIQLQVDVSVELYAGKWLVVAIFQGVCCDA